MSLTLIGKKIGMTQVFDAENQLIPVTAIETGPCPVVQVKTTDKDGYAAVQIGYGPQKPQRVTHQLNGHFEKAGVEPHRELREFRTEKLDRTFSPGDVLTCEEFAVGQTVDIIGQTKGRGFQGVVKRWNFAGGPATHGSMFHRRGGSYGQCQWPGETQKGQKMPGQMGNRRRTTQNLEIVNVIPEKNLILVRGSVHGPKNGIVYVRTSVKTKRQQAA
ncbi:MAG: 50S ribosomal protein L3 [Opitutales bacterium]